MKQGPCIAIIDNGQKRRSLILPPSENSPATVRSGSMPGMSGTFAPWSPAISQSQSMALLDVWSSSNFCQRPDPVHRGRIVTQHFRETANRQNPICNIENVVADAGTADLTPASAHGDNHGNSSGRSQMYVTSSSSALARRSPCGCQLTAVIIPLWPRKFANGAAWLS